MKLVIKLDDGQEIPIYDDVQKEIVPSDTISAVLLKGLDKHRLVMAAGERRVREVVSNAIHRMGAAK